jgi:hypothetical protein
VPWRCLFEVRPPASRCVACAVRTDVLRFHGRLHRRFLGNASFGNPAVQNLHGLRMACARPCAQHPAPPPPPPDRRGCFSAEGTFATSRGSPW